ncbi:unnamed protein product [Symbiodinium sp. CCMP2592]|nr:unnamed protein product [Symbiodinium sp. CCMP2592]
MVQSLILFRHPALDLQASATCACAFVFVFGRRLRRVDKSLPGAFVLEDSGLLDARLRRLRHCEKARRRPTLHPAVRGGPCPAQDAWRGAGRHPGGAG